MKRLRLLAILLGLAGVAPTGVAPTLSAQEGGQSATSLDDAFRSRRALIIGRGSRASYIPEVYTVQRGDTLWDITGRYYGNPYEWPRVWSYNPEVTNPHWIYPLDRLRLRGNEVNAAPLPDGQVTQPGRAQPGTVWLREEGYLDDEALENAGVIIGSPEENMMLSTWDDVYVRFASGARVQPGREYTIFREIEDDEREPDEEGQLVRIYGTVRLRSYDRDRGVGRATVSEALDPIERGYRVAPIPRQFEIVPPRANALDLEGRVVATLRPRAMLADQQVIFVNVGREDQVQLGNRFFIIRQGDDWRESLMTRGLDYGQLEEDAPEPNDDEYPPEVIAEARVVDVRESTATLVVTSSTHEVSVGDKAEMRQSF